MKKVKQILVMLACMLSSAAIACTDARIVAKDGAVVIARSMEFATDLASNMMSSQRGKAFGSGVIAPNGKPAASWKAKYGYLFLDGFNMGVALDGINEKGLSFEYLYLPGETTYQSIPTGKEAQSIPYFLLGDWVLGNFQSIDEVRQALREIYVYAQGLPAVENGAVFPVHAAIHDATGKGIVVEFIKGQMNIFDNQVGVMTNAPRYDWQITNLRNYVNLTPFNPQPTVVDGIDFVATGQGAGMFGLPGDISPPSRFVKTAFLLKTAVPVDNAAAAINLGEHILNNVDIPLGLARAVVDGKEADELTQWVVFKDLTQKVFYFRTYNNMTLRAVSLDKVDLSEKAPTFRMPLAGQPYVVDMTKQFVTP